MKCPVSMLPTGNSTPASILFVIGVIATIGYALKAKQNKVANATAQR